MMFVWPALASFAGSGIIGSTTAPAGSLAWLDFVNESYALGGGPVAVGDILGGGWDPSKIEAQGLRVTADVPAAVPEAAGDLFTVITNGIANGMIVVLEILETRSPGEFIAAIAAHTGATWGAKTDYLTLEYHGYAPFYAQTSSTLTWDWPVAAPSVPQVTKVAILVAHDVTGTGASFNYDYGVSVNGGLEAAWHSNAAQDWGPPDHIHLFGVAGETNMLPWDLHVRSLAIFPPAPYGNLPDYSTA